MKEYTHSFPLSWSEARILEYTKRGDFVFDPFLGAGTSLCAAAKHGRKFCGFDTSPLARLFSSARRKALFVTEEDVERQTQAVLDRFNFYIKSCELFPLPYEGADKDYDDVKNIRNLHALKQAVHESGNDIHRAAFLQTALLMSNKRRRPGLSYSKRTARTENTTALFVQICLSYLEIQPETPPDMNEEEIQILDRDARESICENADFIITSPPYANGIDYVRNYRIEYGWGSPWIEKPLKERMFPDDALSVRYETPALNEKIDRLRKSIAARTTKFHRNYPAMITAYFFSLAQAVEKMYASLKPGRQAVILTGDSNIYGVHIPTDMLTIEIAREAGFELQALEIFRTRKPARTNGIKLREVEIVLRKPQKTKM